MPKIIPNYRITTDCPHWMICIRLVPFPFVGMIDYFGVLMNVAENKYKI